MPYETADFALLRAALVSDTTPAQNGGRMTTVRIPSGALEGLFPNVTPAQRESGLDQWRKAFIGLKTFNDPLPLLSPRVGLSAVSAGEDYYLLYAGTLRDTQNQVTGRPYGTGVLATAIASGATGATVTVETAAYAELDPAPYQDGDLLCLGEAVEFIRIDTAVFAGATLTLTFETPATHDHAAGVSAVAVIEAADTSAAFTDLSTTGDLTYDGEFLSVGSAGVIDQTWTVTVTNAATGALRLDGDILGTGVATGAMGGDFKPVNPTGGLYFKLKFEGWGGTAADGDTLTFTTVPLVIPVWYRRIVPAGAAGTGVSAATIFLSATSLE